ncbi:MAG: hypothetical protein DRK00_10100 [Thermoprotei archaeon]|nr:MAG: hypothetical protein DRK00_10100 [Thermoprotei archaeon]HDD33568.1 hypothetical protein [Thermofilaceae archaeon]
MMWGEKRAVRRVVVDTSLLMCSVEIGRNVAELIAERIEGALEIIVPSVVLEELDRLAESRGRRGILARIARLQVEKLMWEGQCKMLEVEPLKHDADAAIIELAAELDAYLASADEELRRRARRLGVRVLAYRRASRSLE